MSYIGDGIGSSEPTLVRIKVSAVVGLGVFVLVILLPPFSLSPSDGSNATRSAVVRLCRRLFLFIRLAVLVSLALSGLLLYHIIAQGSPVPVIAASSPFPLLPDGKTAWLFSVWRPLMVVLLVGSGVMAAASPTPKYLCILGCSWDVVQCLASAVQIGDYMTQMAQFAAPLQGQYSVFQIVVLYWRDIFSVGVSSWLLFLTVYLAILQGVATEASGPPDVTSHQITSGLADRPSTMTGERKKRLRDQVIFSKKK